MENKARASESLLRKYRRIPKPEVSLPTFMDIAGFPHYENVCSNILGFYFDSTKPHGFSDLLIRSLLEAVGETFDSGQTIDVVDVQREVTTANDKRIDLVIETANHIICIENKIRAALYNDLSEYANHIDSYRYKDGKKQVLIVLSLHRIGKESLTSGFISVTHSDLINRARVNWGRYILKAHPKYVMYLTDFFSTILEFTSMNTVNSEMRRFLLDNHQEVGELVQSWNELHNELENQVKQLAALIKEQPKNVRQWIYGKYDLVHDFSMPDGVMIAVDCWIRVEGVRIRVWTRKGKHSLLPQLQLFQKEHLALQERLNIKNIDWNAGVIFPATTTNEIAEVLTGVLEAIRIAPALASV